MADYKILLVDDEVEYLTSLSERLQYRGLAVDIADGGEAALSLMADDPADIVVLDVIMPGMSGIETLIELKKSYPTVQVIMLSGHTDVETAIQGIALGAFDYMVKPIKIDELIYKIEDAHNMQRF
jgi:DNA-binding response OmpR family regulator